MSLDCTKQTRILSKIKTKPGKFVSEKKLNLRVSRSILFLLKLWKTTTIVFNFYNYFNPEMKDFEIEKVVWFWVKKYLKSQNRKDPNVTFRFNQRIQLEFSEQIL